MCCPSGARPSRRRSPCPGAPAWACTWLRGSTSRTTSGRVRAAAACTTRTRTGRYVIHIVSIYLSIHLYICIIHIISLSLSLSLSLPLPLSLSLPPSLSLSLSNPYLHWQSLAEKARQQAHQAHTPYPQWQSLATKAQDAYTHQVLHPQSQPHPPCYAGEALAAGAAAATAVGSLYPHWEHLTGKMTSRFGGELVKREREEEPVGETARAIWHDSAPNHPGREFAKSETTGCHMAKEETERVFWHDSMPHHDPVQVEAECQLIEVRFCRPCLLMCVRVHIFTGVCAFMSRVGGRFRGSCLLLYRCMCACMYRYKISIDMYIER